MTIVQFDYSAANVQVKLKKSTEADIISEMGVANTV